MAAVDDDVRALQQRPEGEAQPGSPREHRGVVSVQVETRKVPGRIEYELGEREVMRQPSAERDVDPRLEVRRQIDRKAFGNGSDFEVAVPVERFPEGIGRQRANQILGSTGTLRFGILT